MRGLVFILVSVAAAVLTGCGRVTEVERASEQNILLAGNGPEPQGLDPHLTTGIPELNIHMALFEGLVRFDPRNLDPLPGVARKWNVSKDGLQYTFELREDARWSDGERVTAEDFAFAWRRILNPGLGAANAFMLYSIRGAAAFNRGEVPVDELGIEVESSNRIHVRLEQPVPYFLQLLMHPAWYPVPQRVVERHGSPKDRGNRWADPESHVGNGPFRLVRWRHGSRVEAEVNNHYWNAGNVALHGIHFITLEETSAEERAYRAGQLHMTSALPPNRVSWWRDRHPSELRIDPYLGTYYVLLNHRNVVLSDPRVREALSLSIDRRQITENLLGAGQRPATSFSPDAIPGYQPPVRGGPDPERARQLLAEAGYPGGRGFPVLQYLYNTSENHRRIAEALQAIWRQELGIHVELVNQEWRVYLDRREAGQFDLARAVWIGDYVDPETFLRLWSDGAGVGWSGWEHSGYRDAMALAREEHDSNGRMRLLAEAESILLEEDVVIPLYFYVTVFLKRGEVGGVHPNALNWRDYTVISLDR